MQADLMLAGRVRGEGEAALGAVLPRQHHLTAGRGNAAVTAGPPPRGPLPTQPCLHTLPSGSFTSTCIPSPGVEGRKDSDCLSHSCVR